VGQGIVHQPPPLPVGAAPAQDPLVQFVPASNSSPDANTSPPTTAAPAPAHAPVVRPVVVPTLRPGPVVVAPTQRPQVLATRFQRPAPPPPPPPPAGSRCGSGSGQVTITPSLGDPPDSSGVVTNLTAAVDNQVTKAIQLDGLSAQLSFADGSVQVVPLTQAAGAVVGSGQTHSFTASYQSPTAPTSVTVGQFAWHEAGAPQCVGH